MKHSVVRPAPDTLRALDLPKAPKIFITDKSECSVQNPCICVTFDPPTDLCAKESSICQQFKVRRLGIMPRKSDSEIPGSLRITDCS